MGTLMFIDLILFSWTTVKLSIDGSLDRVQSPAQLGVSVSSGVTNFVGQLQKNKAVPQNEKDRLRDKTIELVTLE